MAGAGGVYVGGGATVVMDPASVIYVEVFRPTSGPDRFVKRKAEAVAVAARDLAPLGETGALKSSIRADQNRDEKGRYAFGYSVSASTSYALYVHEGTSASPRFAQYTAKAMKWDGKEGRDVYRDFVWHPGTPAQPFLRNALVAMVI